MAAKLGLSFEPLEALPWAAGVDVFFVISGFVMVHASRGLFARPGASGVFLARRLARIVPLYWGTTTLYLAVALAAPCLLNSALLEPWPVLASYLFIPFDAARRRGPADLFARLDAELRDVLLRALRARRRAAPAGERSRRSPQRLLALAAFGGSSALPQPLGSGPMPSFSNSPSASGSA